MTTKIEQYKQAKEEQKWCVKWAEMLGKQYYGGAGGFGRLSALSLDKVTLYYQKESGDKNYHDMPEELKPHLCDAINARFSELLADALELQKIALDKKVKEAVKEHHELLTAAGLMFTGTLESVD